jgi:hypothetical protein
LLPGLGYVASGFKSPTVKNGSFVYDVPNWGGWITLGNVISGPKGAIYDTLTNILPLVNRMRILS